MDMDCTEETEEPSRLTVQSRGLVPALGGAATHDPHPSEPKPMRNEPSNTHAQNASTSEADLTRRGIRRRRIGRKRIIAAGAIAAVGLIVGTGFTVQSAIATQARIDATAALNSTSGLRSEQLGAYSAIAAAKAIDTAEDTISAANATLAAADGKADTSGLAASVASLSDYRSIPVDEVLDLTKVTRAEAAKTAAAAAAYDQAQASALRPRLSRSGGHRRTQHARRRTCLRGRPRRRTVRLGRRPVPVPRQAVAEGVGLVVHRIQRVERRHRHPAVAARQQDGDRWCGLGDQRGDPGDVGPRLHQERLRHAVQRVVAFAVGQLY